MYHVINRGNYRKDVFDSVGAASAFEAVVRDCSERFDWRLHAYAIMRNHFHLVITTVQPNLSEGMHWLEGTFAVRFNRLRAERGHLFQGRFYAGLIEDAAALRRVVDYVHLNPVRAKILLPETASQFRWSSLGRYVKANAWSCMESESWLSQTVLGNTQSPWASYLMQLASLGRDAELQKANGFDEMGYGWAIGTHGWKAALARECAHVANDSGLTGRELRAFKQARWTQCLEEALAQAGKTEDDACSGRTAEPWKVAIACKLRGHGVPARWIADALHMRSAGAVRTHVCCATKLTF